MPNFNKAPFIGAAMDSVLAQTFRDYELLVVDDCSADSSAEIVRAYAEDCPSFRAIFQSRHFGASAARNRGIQESRGMHVALLDSDDVYVPSWLDHGVKTLRGAGEPSVVYSNWWVMGASGRRIRRARPHTTRSGMLFPDLLLNSLEVNTAIIAPRSCFLEAGPYDESLEWGEDYDFVLKLAKKYPFLYLDEEAYGYRLHRGNSWKQFPRERMYERKAAMLSRHIDQGRSLLDDGQAAAISRKLAYYQSRSGRTYEPAHPKPTEARL